MKAFDPSKFRKSITKNIKGISMGFRDPKVWISSGNYALNYLISGDFNKGFPLGKVTMVAGEPGAGKSYIASANVVKNAQDQGIFVILIDTEHALDKKWLEALGVDTAEDKLLRVEMAMIDDVAKFIYEFMDGYKNDYSDVDEKDRPRILIVVDSLGMLLTPTDVDQFKKGDLKGDFGRAPRALKALIKNCVIQFGKWDVGMICTNHVYASQDMFNPDDKIYGGNGPIFAASQVVAIKKQKLREDDEGREIKGVPWTGITADVKVMKSRFSKPFESVKIKIPYERGMDPYSGLFNLFEKKGLLTKEGSKYYYKDSTKKYWDREIKLNVDGILDEIMAEWDEPKVSLTEVVDEEND